MIGDTWEWTADWYSERHAVGSSCCGATVNPRGRNREHSIDAGDGAPIPRKVLKGSSWTGAESYCQRYRPAARMPHTVDTGTNHLSYRRVGRA
jgi:sulfatase modifying factor 1